MEIKKLTKDLIAEGITLELVNSVDLKRRCSPVQLQKGDEPVSLLVCSSGFNILTDGKVIRDSKNIPIVIKERECQIARARYLVNHGETEKQTRITDLVNSWKESVRTALDSVKEEVGRLKSMLNPDESSSPIISISKAIAQQDERHWEVMAIKFRKQLEDLEPAYLKAEEMYAKNQIMQLLGELGLKEVKNPMLSVRFDNAREMRVLINTFSAKAIQNWDGDMTTKYAQIEIEQTFPN